jgi:hypothetical protein
MDVKTFLDDLLNSRVELEKLCTASNQPACENIVSNLKTSYDQLTAYSSSDQLNTLNYANKDTTINLADKKTTVKIMNEKTKNLQNHIENIKQERLNKKRVVEASEWEYDRYNSHIYILKYIFFSLVLVNVILFIRKNFGFIPDMISFGLIIFIIAVMLYNVGTEMLLNTKRDKFDYDKFKQPTGDEYNVNDGTLGVAPKSKSGNIFQKLVCEPFVNSNKKDTLNRHTYSFIN